MALGGLEEIGRNCLVLEYQDDILVIDAGIMFPSEDMPGVDLVIPDFRYLAERKERVRGILLTHGHEDHIGGLPFLLSQVQAPVYATPLTRGLIEGRLRSRGLLDKIALHTIQPGDEIALGAFSVEPFHVNHSIPDAVGFAIRTPVGLVVHTGDFKIDHTPLDGRPIDLGQLAAFSREGVRLLLSDSTNAESPGYTPSESALQDTFREIFAKARGRIIVATFASLLSRVQLVIETAARLGRRVAVAGRSMEENIAIAERLGYVRFPEGTRVPLQEIGSLPDEQVCILATGSQGEPNAALARMAAGNFRQVVIGDGDTVVLSSKAIPGNETAIYRNIDTLFMRGADVIYGEKAGIHVSGHGGQEELKILLNLLRPEHFVPVHGEYRMLHLHARMAHEMGIPVANTSILRNGLPLELDSRSARLGEQVEVETVLVDGSLVGEVGTSLLRDRVALAKDGFVVARVALDRASGQMTGYPEIVTQGFVHAPSAGTLLATAETAIADVVRSEGNGAGAREAQDVGKRIQRRLEHLFYDETRRRPVVLTQVKYD